MRRVESGPVRHHAALTSHRHGPLLPGRIGEAGQDSGASSPFKLLATNTAGRRSHTNRSCSSKRDLEAAFTLGELQGTATAAPHCRIVWCAPAQFWRGGTVGAGRHAAQSAQARHLPDNRISTQLAIKCGGEVMGFDTPAPELQSRDWLSAAQPATYIKSGAYLAGVSLGQQSQYYAKLVYLAVILGLPSQYPLLLYTSWPQSQELRQKLRQERKLDQELNRKQELRREQLLRKFC